LQKFSNIAVLVRFVLLMVFRI